MPPVQVPLRPFPWLLLIQYGRIYKPQAFSIHKTDESSASIFPCEYRPYTNEDVHLCERVLLGVMNFCWKPVHTLPTTSFRVRSHVADPQQIFCMKSASHNLQQLVQTFVSPLKSATNSTPNPQQKIYCGFATCERTLTEVGRKSAARSAE